MLSLGPLPTITTLHTPGTDSYLVSVVVEPLIVASSNPPAR